MASSGMRKSLKDEVGDVPRLVQQFLAADRDQLDLSQLIGATGLHSQSCGGIHEDDYPDQRLPQLTKIRHKSLPPELIEQFAHMQSNCIMGIFPEIGRAWLTVDSDIFVWRYADGEDLAYFDGLSEPISSVALVKPKPGIFKDEIRFLLVLTTRNEVVILGVSFSEDDANSEMQLIPDPLFTLNTEDVELLHTVGSESGRIFTGGKDGCLYEIAYQPSGGWFGRKCSKINHSRSKLSYLLPNRVNNWLADDDAISQIVIDDTRNVIYTRTDKGTITGYDLGADGQGMTCFAQVRLDTIKRKAAGVAANIPPSNFNKIVHIAPITRRESRNIQLVAVTQSGVRFFFMNSMPFIPQLNQSAMSGSHSLIDNSSSKRPTHLELVHVRMPPGYTSGTIGAPANVHKTHYNAGTLVMAASDQNDDVIWCISKNHFASEKSLSETQVKVPFNGRTWVITEVPEPPSPLCVACLPVGVTDIPPDPPIHVIQHFQRPSEYVVVSAQGCYMFNKMRPVDQLRYLLETRQDLDSEALINFFKLHKNGEASAACIILGMSTLVGDGMLTSLAVAAFERHGEEAYYRYPDLQQNPTTLGQAQNTMGYGHGVMSPIPGQKLQDNSARGSGQLPIISTPMPGATNISNVTFQGVHTVPQPPPISNATLPGTDRPTLPELCHSDSMKGLFKMFGRITRPIWEGRLIEEYNVSNDGVIYNLYTNRTDVEILSHILNDLNSFKQFIETHCLPRLHSHRGDSGYRGGSNMMSSRFESPGFYGSTNPRQNSRRMHQIQADQAEAKLIQSLYLLVEHATQVLGLWRFICDHEVHIICQSLPMETLTSLQTVTFSEFTLDCSKIAGEMITIIVNRYINDNAEVDALNARLRQICPSLYSLDDVITSRAFEMLNVARQTTRSQQESKLAECLELYQKVAHCVNLCSVSQQFQSVGFYEGVIELCATAAEKRDSKNLALHYYKTGNGTEENIEGRKAYEARAECYKVVTDMMDDLMLASESAPQTPSVPAQLGPPSQANPNPSKTTPNLQPEEAQRFAEACMHLLMKSSDELLHVTIYDWMLRKKLADRLLRISSPYLERYLKRVTASHPDDQTYCDILWQHYEKAGDHAAAAKILARLADSTGKDRDLQKRIEYLSRAKMNGKSASSVTSVSTGGQLLHELEEKLEVAQLQFQILQTLEEMDKREAVRALNSELMDITKLYSDYAEPFNLAECKLAIVHCAGHYDPSLINALWQNILDQEMVKLRTQSSQNQITALKMKVSQLGKKYSNASRYFPVEFLVDYLEKISCLQNWPEQWVFHAILDSGVDLITLVELYQDIHRQKLPHWSECGSPYHILRIIHQILSAFVENPEQYVPVSKRRLFVTNALDSIAQALVELQSTVQPSEQLIETRTRFKVLQSKMVRLEDEIARRY